MWRYLAGAAAALLLAAAGMIFLGRGAATEIVPRPPRAAMEPARQQSLPEAVPRASDRTREEKRFDRYDKDRNDAITRDEYLASRRKAYAKLDRNSDGKLSFDEWVVRTADKFVGADKDRSSTLTRAEFATTAPKRRPKPACRCEKMGEDKAAED